MRIFWLSILIIFAIGCKENSADTANNTVFEEKIIISDADALLKEDPVTITSFIAERSKGGLHDYYSEGPYWWPDTTNAAGPYIRRDGIRNPNNFNGHRTSLKQFEDKVTTLTAAYLITKDKVYAQKAEQHLLAWFVNDETLMNPHVEYGQAIKGIVDGRGIGIIDIIGLIDVSIVIRLLSQEGGLSESTLKPTVAWYEQLSKWLVESNHGQEEANNNNNHSTWWGAQLAAYAKLTGNKDHLKIAQEKFKSQLDIQMKEDGSLPHELDRTKPFHYMNYTVQAWAKYALLLSHQDENYWTYKGTKGQMSEMVEFAYNHYKNLEEWPYFSVLEPSIDAKQQDYFLFAANGLKEHKYKTHWQESTSDTKENNSRLYLFNKLFGLL